MLYIVQRLKALVWLRVLLVFQFWITASSFSFCCLTVRCFSNAVV